MAAGPLLISEPLQRYRALGFAGDPVWRAAGQLRTAIAQRLSRRHADLLAIPEVDPTGRRIDWYAPIEGDVRAFADLDGTERMTVLGEVHRLHGEIAALAEAMEAPQRSSAERNFARLLRHALTAPGEDTLYVVDGKPVMTFWGFSADAALPGVFLASPPVAPQPAAVARPLPQAVMASAPAVAAIGTRSPWWQWLLLAVLLLLLLALLAWQVRPYLPRIEPYLEAEARDRALSLAVRQPVELQRARVDTLQQDNENLRLELARLTDEVSRRGSECAAAVVVPGGVVVAGGSNAPIERGANPDAPAVGADVNMANKDLPKDMGKDASKDPGKDLGKDQAKDPGRDQGKGPDDKNVDKGNAKGPDEQIKDKNAAAKNEPKPMVVPPEAKQKQDLAFLKGDWHSRTGLATATGERDLRPNYSLDDKGKGKVSFVQKNGTTCEAPAEARWDGSKLVIEEKANPKCADGRTYARNTVNCEIGADGQAKCTGSQPGDKRSYNVQIGR
jgi:hypothetical protein